AAALSLSGAANIAGLLGGSPPAAGGPTGLVGWWKFNESGGNAADSTGHGNTGTLNGDAAYTTGQNSTNAITPDGTGDYVEVANESNFDFERTDPFSWSAWIKLHAIDSGQFAVISKGSPSGNQPGIDFRTDTDN